jgi:hypothetical protein
MRLLISGFDDGERAGMDYYGEARCMVGLVLGRGEERRRGGEAAACFSEGSYHVSGITYDLGGKYHVSCMGRAAGEDRGQTDETRRRYAGCVVLSGAWPGWMVHYDYLLGDGRAERESLAHYYH